MLHDRERIESAGMCGACHDIVSPQGAAIERTYLEWQTSTFADPVGGETCGQCHMKESTSPEPIASVAGAPAREYHAHDFPAVDTAFDPAFPNLATEKANVLQALQGTTLQVALCVTQDGAVRVIVDNVGAGHFWPSGAAQDRRAWAEVIAYKGGAAIYQSGVVPDGTPVTAVQADPDLWLLRDCMFDAQSQHVDMFWQAATTEGYELPMPTTTDATSPDYYKTHIVQSFPRAVNGALPQMPDQVTMRIRLQPVGIDVIDDLVDGGDLDAGIVANMPTWDVVPLVTWTPSTATLTYADELQQPVTCVAPVPFNVAADKFPATANAGCSP